MACRFAFFVIASLFSPIHLLAQWHVASGKDPVTGGNIYTAQIDRVKLQDEEKRTKTRMSIIFACSSQWPETYLAMFLDAAPVFSIPEEKGLPMKSIPVAIFFQNAGNDKPTAAIATVSQWRKKSKELLVESDFTKKLLRSNVLSSYESLTIGFLPTWDDAIVTAKAPLRGATAAINKAAHKCNSETQSREFLDEINRSQTKMQEDLQEIQRDLQEIVEDLESGE